MALITKEIPGFQGYSVSECGVVVGKRCYLSPNKDRRGYYRVWLYRGGRRVEMSVHRCVAITWVQGDTRLTVNHKDGNKSNNTASNLEWISSADNTRHSFRAKLRDTSNTWKTRRAINNGFLSVDAETQSRVVATFMAGGTSMRQLAKDFCLSRTTVAKLIKRNKAA